MILGIVELYQGGSGKKGFYNSQEIGLARAMKKIGYESVIFYPNSNIIETKEEKIEEGILVISCPAKNIGVHSKYDWNILKKYRVDVVQVGSDNQLFASDLLKFCDRINIPAYCFIGTVGSDTATGIKKVIMDILFKRNTHTYKNHKCFVKTERVYKQLEGKGIKDIEIAPVGLDTTVIPKITESRKQLRTEMGISEDTIVLLFVGRMDEYKRPMETFTIIEEFKGQDVLAIVIGTGELDNAFEEKILSEGLGNQIKRVKRIPNSEIHKYYKLADYYLNYNQVEIFGMSILEAMYQGCTVIANHAPGPDFIIVDGVSGYLVNNTAAMIKIIIENQHPKRDEIVSRIEHHFLWDTTAQKIDEWIKK